MQDDLAQDPAGLAAPDQPPVGDGAVDWNLMKVPATIEIDGGLLTARDVAGLAAGSVLSLPAAAGTVPVRVVVGGAVVGAGDLVAVGEGFGVLFTSVASAPADTAEG